MNYAMKLVYIEYFKGVTSDQLYASGFDKEAEKFERIIWNCRVPLPLEELISRSLTDYPDLFPDRRYVLDHLFCVIGNGYEWCRGGLVDRFPGLRDVEREFHKKREEELEQIEQSVIKILGPDAIDRQEKEFKIYPIHSEYSHICTIPKNVRDDYIDGIIEIIELIYQYGSPKDIAAIRDIKQNILSKIGYEQYDKRCVHLLYS